MRIGFFLFLVAQIPYPALAQKSSERAPAQVAGEVRAFRMANEGRIVRELTELLAIPNVATDSINIQRNASKLVEMLEVRGIEAHPLPVAGRGPVIFGKLSAPGAKRTLIFYAHYDGQPVDPAAWTESKPFEPVLRTNSIEAGGKRLTFPDASSTGPVMYENDWRIYARSASDDKSPIVALLVALDALREKKIPLRVNLKIILDGEEEAGSPNLERSLLAHRNLLAGDLLISADGPVHQSGAPLIAFGNRGVADASLTVYGPIRALHSGHYGNWAPNPAFQLAQLLASMKDSQGRVLIEGFYDDVEPLGRLERKALNEAPDNDAELMSELQFSLPEGGGKKLVELINLPSLNIRGMNSAYVGKQSQNVVPDQAEASLDLRLVKNVDPRKQFDRLVAHVRKQGFYITDKEPTRVERLGHPRVAKIVYGGGYPASRTPMNLPAATKLIAVIEEAVAGTIVKMPTMGGSAPMYIFENLNLPVIGVPIVNYDNHQHSSDENLRLGHFWRGIEIYAAILADLEW